MKFMTLTAAAALLAFAAPANAALLSLGPPGCASNVCEGITYTLEMEIPDPTKPLTAEFALTITGENSASDTIGGRTGINAIAFNTVSNNNPASGTMLSTTINGTTNATPPFVFVPGGLSSSGCDGNGGFYCFDNTTIPPTPGSPLITGEVTMVFDATLTSGSWTNYATAFKIDWVGPNVNNYSLVSADIPVNTACPDCVPTPTSNGVNEPGSFAMLGTALGFALGLLGFARCRNRKDEHQRETIEWLQSLPA